MLQFIYICIVPKIAFFVLFTPALHLLGLPFYSFFYRPSWSYT